MEYESAVNPPTIAVAIDTATGWTDQCWTWETGQNYAQSGYLVIAIGTEPGTDWTAARQQQLYDTERRFFIDCYGRSTPFDSDD